MNPTPQDCKLAKSWGVSLDDAPSDPHAGCLRMWNEERAKREAAERSSHHAWLAVEAAEDARDEARRPHDRERWRAAIWRFVALIGWTWATVATFRWIIWP